MQKTDRKSLKRYFQLLLLIFFLIPGFLYGGQSRAEEGLSAAQKGLNQAATKGFEGEMSDSAPTSIMVDIPTAIGKIIGAILAFVGVLFFILMIYGGVIWMTARGNETAVTKAKDLIQSSIIGLIIVLAAYTITAFISSKLID